MVDALGNLVDFVLLPSQRHDLIGADPLLVGVEFEALIADRAYDSNALRDELKKRGVTVVIPPRSNRVETLEYDVEMYKACPRESGGGAIWWRISFVISNSSVVLRCVLRRRM